jgi:hypothetical protein
MPWRFIGKFREGERYVSEVVGRRSNAAEREIKQPQIEELLQNPPCRWGFLAHFFVFSLFKSSISLSLVHIDFAMAAIQGTPFGFFFVYFLSFRFGMGELGFDLENGSFRRRRARDAEELLDRALRGFDRRGYDARLQSLWSWQRRATWSKISLAFVTVLIQCARI